MSSSEEFLKTLGPLVDLPAVQRLLSEASGLRARAIRLEEATIAALGLPSSEGLARLERRLRAVSDGIDALGARLDRLDVKMARLDKALSGLDGATGAAGRTDPE